MLNLTFIPKLSNSLFYSSKRDKHLFLNTDLPNWIVLNSNGAYIVGLVDGKKSIQNILDSLNNKLPKDDILNLFNNLKEFGIINDEELLQNKYFCECKKSNNNTKLHLVHLKLTNDCNLSCKYCYAESGVNYKSLMSVDEFKSIIDEIQFINPNVDYTISGGEPFLHPNVIEIMEYIQSLGNRICLITNGMLINKENAPKIAKLCFLIKVSIDGSSEEINSITRGKNSFESALKGYELLLNEKANVQVSMTVTKANINDIENMAKKFGNRLMLQPFFKAGRGTDNDNLQISGIEYYEAMANIEHFQPMAKIGETLEMYRGRGTTKCTMADSEINIAHNGDVFPCHMLAEDEFKGGNIKQNRLIDILNSDIFKKVASFSSLINDDCKECPIKLLCGGACRARSYLETGNLFKNSEFCDYEKLAFINGIFENSKF